MSRKIIAVIAVVVAIVVIVGGGIGGYIYQLSSQKIEMKDILVSVDKKTNGVEVGIITVPTEFSGTATVGITYSATSTYDTTIEVNNGEGKKTVPYPDFVTENGNYTFEVTFKDKTKTKDCSIYGVVTKIDVYANAILDGTQPKIEVEVWPDTVAPLGVAVVNITKVGGSALVTAEALTLSETGIYSGTFSYNTNSGYYTIYVTLTNPVKSDSEYLEITKENLTFINLQPNVQSPPDNTTNLAPNGSYFGRGKEGWINFDATGLATDYDGDITVYAWDFGYNETLGRPANPKNNETNDFAIGIEVSYQYEATGIYTVTLSVLDNEDYANNANCTVTVHAIPI